MLHSDQVEGQIGSGCVLFFSLSHFKLMREVVYLRLGIALVHGKFGCVYSLKVTKCILRTLSLYS